MKIIHATASKPTRVKNDDIAGHAGNVYWLMDGATELIPPPHGRDASWHVGQLHQAFLRALRDTPAIDLPALARQAIADVARDFYAATGLTAASSHELRPFATLVLCRYDETNHRLQYLIVTDSTLAVVGKNREFSFTDRRLSDLDALAGTAALLRQGHGFTSDEFKTEMRNVYNNTFRHLNTPAGFDVVGQDENVIDRAVTGTIKIEPGDAILLMSDGFTRAVDTLNIYPDWTALAAAIDRDGPAAIIDQIRAAERADSTGRRFPRSSLHDDATLLMLRPAVLSPSCQL